MAAATSKKPPSWNPEQKEYSFRDFTRDLVLWEQATDLRDGQKGPAVALQLRGETREVVRDLDPRELSLGRVDAPTQTSKSSLTNFSEGLARSTRAGRSKLWKTSVSSGRRVTAST